MTATTLPKLAGSLCLLVVSCSSNSYDPGNSPSSANLPSNAANTGTYTTVNAFPSLSFNDPLLVSGIPGENRIAVAEQAGRIVVFDNDVGSNTKSTVLDISSKVLFAGEQGLLGLAFDPEFTQNRYVYVHYSAGKPRRNVISRMRWDPGSDELEESREKVIIEIEQPYSNHNGGTIAFGPDGFLYIGIGDGGSGGDPHNYAQDKTTLLGKVLRLDVHPDDTNAAYAIPADNPFIAEAGSRGEIYAYGLRNPFRFSFDQETGELWLGDVGQNAVEEIDVLESGGNYGWRVLEGSQPYDNELNNLSDSAFLPPVFEYDHSEGVSVTGGLVYRGVGLPLLAGHYIYADYGSGNIWALTLDGTRVIANTLLSLVSTPTALGETNEAELLIVSRAGGIYKLERN